VHPNPIATVNVKKLLDADSLHVCFNHDKSIAFLSGAVGGVIIISYEVPENPKIIHRIESRMT